MQIHKKYFHDRLILLLISVNAFLTIFTSLLILLRLDNQETQMYITSYRSNLGLNAFSAGDVNDMIMLIIFAVLTFVAPLLISMKAYTIKRYYSVLALSLALLILVLTFFVSNALLGLR
jgi:hypothetical protein